MRKRESFVTMEKKEKTAEKVRSSKGWSDRRKSKNRGQATKRGRNRVD